jgi:acetyl-CoA carboxylase biotin carboxyl carrier protein
VPDLSYTEVGEILLLLQRIEGSDVTLQWGDLSVHVRRGAGAPEQHLAAQAQAATEPTPVPSSTSPATEVATPAAEAIAAEPTPAPTATAPADDGVTVPDHWVAVNAPMVGTFYRSPTPGEPPFVEVGDTVAAGDAVGLVEVMKLFTELTSDVAGKIARIDADDATLVEYGQPLMWVEP